jgi:hypothetical protein
VKGKIVMVGAPAVVPVTILTPQKRREDNDVRAQYDPINPQQQNFGGGGGPQGPSNPNIVPAGQVAEQLDQFLVAAGAAGRISGPRARTDPRFNSALSTWRRPCRTW